MVRKMSGWRTDTKCVLTQTDHSTVSVQKAKTDHSTEVQTDKNWYLVSGTSIKRTWGIQMSKILINLTTDI